jgi:hypothetical protein
MELELYEECVGSCTVCGSDATGSRYWLGMTDEQWAIVRPLITHMFKPDMVQNVLFIPQLCKPLCSPECALTHKEETDGKAA